MTIPRTAGHCVKCGREIDPDESMCEVCNRAGMVAPAATQMHGTVAVAVIGAVALMAVVASILTGGVGPFSAEAADWDPVAEASVRVSVVVANDGSRAGRARCELSAVDGGGRVLARTVALSPEVPPGSAVSFETRIPGMTEDPARITVRCQ